MVPRADVVTVSEAWVDVRARGYWRDRGAARAIKGERRVFFRQIVGVEGGQLA